jgi:hypothetical protein
MYIRWLNENIPLLMAQLDPEDLDEQFMMTELYRNLGEFNTCIKIIHTMENEALKWLNATFIKQCDKGNRWLFLLEEGKE